MDTKTKWQTNRQTNTQTNKTCYSTWHGSNLTYFDIEWAFIRKNILVLKWAPIQSDKPIDRQRDRQTGRQTERQDMVPTLRCSTSLVASASCNCNSAILARDTSSVCLNCSLVWNIKTYIHDWLSTLERSSCILSCNLKVLVLTHSTHPPTFFKHMEILVLKVESYLEGFICEILCAKSV